MLRGSRNSWVAGLLSLVFLLVGNDSLQLNPAQLVSLGQQFSLVRWEASNLPDKWVHRLLLVGRRDHTTESYRRAQVNEYFLLSAQLNELRDQIAEVVVEEGGGRSNQSIAINENILRVHSDMGKMRSAVEETIEATIAEVLRTEGIKSWGPVTFPPVDIRLGQVPKVLIVSPRHRIAQMYMVLLEPDVSLAQSEEMEQTLEGSWDLSAIVVSAGGLATYPALVEDQVFLNDVLRAAAHEWVHHYLVFLPPDRPLGRNISASSSMHTLNETFADIVAGEIEDLALENLSGVLPGMFLSQTRVARSGDAGERAFDFSVEMREIRQRVDDLLRAGSVAEAETYMDLSREFLEENGVHIRKLNQAYFAFFGNYALLPQSSSSIGPQMREMRDLVPDLKSFVDVMSRVSSYEGFVQALGQLRAE